MPFTTNYEYICMSLIFNHDAFLMKTIFKDCLLVISQKNFGGKKSSSSQSMPTQHLCIVHFSEMYVLRCVQLCDSMDGSLPDSSAHGILQARILEWVAIFSSRKSSWPRDWTQVFCISCTDRQILYQWQHLGALTEISL